MKKTILALILSIVMLMSLFPAYALATTDDLSLGNVDNSNDIIDLGIELYDEREILSLNNSRIYPDEFDEMVNLDNLQNLTNNEELLLTPNSQLSSFNSIQGAIGNPTPNAYNNNPNTAIFLPDTYYGLDLYDLADADDHWYYFTTTGTNKIAITFFQESDGDYDLLLYKLNGSNLYLVDYSGNTGTFERISYIADAGTYFLRVAPAVPAAVPYYFAFILDVIGNYDSYESNDFYYEPYNFSNAINVSANIDNCYDEDWYELTVSTRKLKDITVSNAPSGNNYAVFVYDNNFNSVGSFFVNVSATRSVDFYAGQYYIRVLSYTGYYTTTNYNLTVEDYIPGILLTSGHRVELTSSQLLINGQPAIINGTYMNYNYYSYRVSEAIQYFGNSLLPYDTTLRAYRYTYYTDGIGYRTSTVIPIIITDGYYNCFNGKNGYWSWYFDTDPNRPLGSQTTNVIALIVYVDLDTGRVVDNFHSMHYTTSFYNITQNPLIPY